MTNSRDLQLQRGRRQKNLRFSGVRARRVTLMRRATSVSGERPYSKGLRDKKRIISNRDYVSVESQFTFF